MPLYHRCQRMPHSRAEHLQGVAFYERAAAHALPPFTLIGHGRRIAGHIDVQHLAGTCGKFAERADAPFPVAHRAVGVGNVSSLHKIAYRTPPPYAFVRTDSDYPHKLFCQPLTRLPHLLCLHGVLSPTFIMTGLIFVFYVIHGEKLFVSNIKLLKYVLCFQTLTASDLPAGLTAF